MKNNTLIHLQDLNLFEMFTIPSIGLTGTLLDCNISSAKVVYHNMQISDKMGKNVAKKEVTELISPNTDQNSSTSIIVNLFLSSFILIFPLFIINIYSQKNKLMASCSLNKIYRL